MGFRAGDLLPATQDSQLQADMLMTGGRADFSGSWVTTLNYLRKALLLGSAALGFSATDPIQAGAATFQTVAVSSSPGFTGDGSGLSNVPATSLTGTIPSARLSGTYTISISGNAATATSATNASVLNPGATINGVTFTGGSNITVAAAAGTLTGAALASNVINSSLQTFGNLAASLSLSADNAYDLGSSSFRWRSAYVAGTITAASYSLSGNIFTLGLASDGVSPRLQSLSSK